MTLCLTRKENQSLMIGEAKVTIARVRGGQTRLLIDAPKSVQVLRTELLDRDVRSQTAA